MAVLMLGACSPTLDWRQLRPEGWQLAVSLPCRPSNQVRQLPLAGQTVDLRLLACRADEHLFAVASAELADPSRVGPALQALGASALANVQGGVEGERPAAVPGMTPQAAARQWQVAGRMPDGQPVRLRVLVFAHGLRVFQVTLLGPQAGEAMAKALFDSVEVLP